MIFQFVIVRKGNDELECMESTPCWVPVSLPIKNPAADYGKYQYEFKHFVETHNLDSDDIEKSFELLLDDWRENDPALYSIHEIESFARQLESESFEITPTYFNGVLEEVHSSYKGSVNVTIKQEEGVEDA